MKHNFSAGPSILPKEVMKKAAMAVLDFEGSGLSLIEISHRSKAFIAVMDKACELVSELMGLPKGYKVLFLQGGASMQFVMAPYNLCPQGGKVGYLDTGTWSSKAMKEGKKFGELVTVASSKDKGYNYVPKGYEVPADIEYLHMTTNNTIFGTQLKDFPKGNFLKVCDMSSDIFSRVLDFEQFDVIYAGAQKNMGPAGTTLVIVKESILGSNDRDIPTMLDYRTHIDKGSMFNTPPVFAVYTAMLTLQWLKEQGGIASIEKKNNEKAALLYDLIDADDRFIGFANREDRSHMNVTFNLSDKSLEPRFDQLCEEAGISGIRGHRSVGGYRASIYNAMPLESVQALVAVMKQL